MKNVSCRYMVYRGVSLNEALDVLIEQRYFRSERVQFNSDCGANAVFGDGVYFTESFTLAAEYAQCHAIREKDRAAVLVQTLAMKNPLFLNERYTEKQLRIDTFRWRFGSEYVKNLVQEDKIAEIHLSESIRSYVLSLEYDGIVLDLPDGSKYFVAYHPDLQIKNIRMDFLFSVCEALTKTLSELRTGYKNCYEFTYL
jgi:hypothetical protein